MKIALSAYNNPGRGLTYAHSTNLCPSCGWKFLLGAAANGCQHCAWLFCFCDVFERDQMRLTENGEPKCGVIVVPTAQITIVDTWEVSGLAGTGSHDVVIERVFVPGEYTCEFGPGATPQGKHFQGPLYRYPSALPPRCRLAPWPGGSPKGRWTRAWNWRHRSVLHMVSVRSPIAAVPDDTSRLFYCEVLPDRAGIKHDQLNRAISNIVAIMRCIHNFG